MRRTRREIFGNPASIHGVEVTPVMEVHEMTLGSGRAAISFAAARPTAIEVRDHGGPARRLAITDPHRRLRLLMLLALAATFLLRRKDD
jgi:hypothetical protein